MNGLSDDDYRVIVLLGHVDPAYGNAGNSQDFFEGFANIVRGLGKPTMHFHGDRHKYYELEGGEHGVNNYLIISLTGKSITLRSGWGLTSVRSIPSRSVGGRAI